MIFEQPWLLKKTAVGLHNCMSLSSPVYVSMCLYSFIKSILIYMCILVYIAGEIGNK